MAGEIQDIIDELVTIQKAIAPPAGEKDIAEAYDEPPAQVLTFPCFVNLEDDIFAITRSSGLRQIVMPVSMALLFAPADQKYSIRSRRRWVKAVIDAFDAAVRLNNNQTPVQYAPIEAVSYEPVLIGDTEYVGATFSLIARLYEAFTFDG